MVSWGVVDQERRPAMSRKSKFASKLINGWSGPRSATGSEYTCCFEDPLLTILDIYCKYT